MPAIKGGAPEANMVFTTIIDIPTEVRRHLYGICIRPA
jgi:hypothetical protein